MRGDDRIRFCDHCRKNVFNISAMTHRDAEALISETQGQLCTRFFRRPDGTILTEDCPVGIAAVRKHVARAAAAVMSSMLSFASVAMAQVQQTVSQQAESQTATEVTGAISGTVKDPASSVVPGAEVTCTNVKSGKTFKTRSSDLGEFKLESLPIGNYTVETVSPGFSTCRKAVVISQLRPARLDPVLTLGMMMGEVVSVDPKISPMPTRLKKASKNKCAQ
jgi:hypothetical protein